MSTEEKAVVEYRAKDGTQIKLSPQIIRRYLVSGRSELVTDQELFIYMGLCKSRGLNPFIKDCYITKFSPNDPAAIITSIDYYRKRARAQKDCKGWTYGIIILGDKGQPVYRNGCLLLDDEKLIGGWAEATPEGWTVPMRKEVNLKRYIKKTKEGVVTRFWSPDNQPEQIAKVAESQMLRAAWPDEFQGLYVDSEIQSRNAQEDLDAAVSTATPDDTPAPDFNTVFADELADQLFAPWAEDLIKRSAENEKKTVEETRIAFVEQAKQVRELFTKWKMQRSKTPLYQMSPDSALPAYTSENSGPAEKNTITDKSETTNSTKEPQPGTADDFRSKWINLKEAGFSTFVFKNIDKFKALEGGALLDAVTKWQKIYPTFNCPFVAKKPVDTEQAQQDSGEAQGAAQMVEVGGNPPDFEAVELDRLRAELKLHLSAHSDIVKQAMHDTGIAAPQTIDGFRVLIEEIEARISK